MCNFSTQIQQAGSRNGKYRCSGNFERPYLLRKGRFCTTEGIENVIPLSDYRYTSDFGEKYGVLMTDGVLCGLLARAVVIINPEGKVIYTELVPEITQEPNYDSALAALKEQR